MKKKSGKVLVIADGYPTSKNIFKGSFVKHQLETLKKNYPDWHFDIYFNPFFKLFSNPLEKESVLWNIVKWSMQLICFFPCLFKSYDLVHAHRFFLPVMNGAAYKFFHKVPLIATSHGIVQIRKRYNKKWTKKLFHYCDLIIAVNHEMKKEFIKKFSLEENAVAVRSCGVNFSEFDSVEASMIPVKKNKDHITMGFVGDFSEIKRPIYFIKCVEALYKKYKIHGIMIGGGKNAHKMKNYIKKNNLPITVKDTMPHKDVIKYYFQIDILIFPSAIETFGLVGIEALYSHVPVVASAVGGKMDYIQDNINGLLFENDNVNDLIKKTETLILNRDKLNVMRSKARKSVELYSNEQVAKEILDLYKLVLENEV